jgi:hypothetical protein
LSHLPPPLNSTPLTSHHLFGAGRHLKGKSLQVRRRHNPTVWSNTTENITCETVHFRKINGVKLYFVLANELDENHPGRTLLRAYLAENVALVG